jgi:TonB family protein
MKKVLLMLVVAATSIGLAQKRDGFGPCVIDKTLSKTPSPTEQMRPKRIPRVSDGLERMCFSARPVYPPTAKAKKIEGVVVMAAILGKDGFVKELRLVSGDPLLAASGLEAVRQWRYRPVRLNGKTIEVETLVRVYFKLDSGDQKKPQSD